ncbi:hypothetical protein EJ02DRAFT_471618 [Clathrospora elynae]|uniref:Uncharacterized protein n=1 Tax=Clathrospora elynae TaxID=706981 RepID=A0A6A5S508_9PLEO|nr:hypothetical protein EJ02DRAFT_471618 [Clathrospora elynae]
MVGAIAVIASIVHLYALWVLLLSQIEINIAIISASAPALRPLFSLAFTGSSYGQSKKHPSDYGNGPGSKVFPRSHRARSNGQMELSYFAENDRTVKNKIGVGVTQGTSEEFILGSDDITKTVDLGVDEDFTKVQMRGESKLQDA